MDDVEQIRRNAQKYNDETSIVHKNAAKLARLFKGRLQSMYYWVCILLLSVPYTKSFYRYAPATGYDWAWSSKNGDW